GAAGHARNGGSAGRAGLLAGTRGPAGGGRPGLGPAGTGLTAAVRPGDGRRRGPASGVDRDRRARPELGRAGTGRRPALAVRVFGSGLPATVGRGGSAPLVRAI